MESRKDMLHFCREALELPESLPIELSSFEGRGSDRTFFRVKWDRKNSAILVHYNPARIENTYYAAIAAFLHDIHVPVPRLIYHDSTACLMMMEDLGDTDLWALRKTPWDIRRTLYQKTLTAVHRLHTFPGTKFPSEQVRLMQEFGPSLYRWERDYFRDYFVRGACGLKLQPSLDRELEKELSALAERLSGLKRCLVHRDLQSRNVMIRGGEPFLIDFQGMRFGNPFYDLGSLLCDPYVDFSVNEREELLSFHYQLSKGDLDWAAFRNYFWEASAQRLMQALGAYGFLGLKKGLKAFLEHIPSGIHNLLQATGQVSFLPHLQELSLACRREMETTDKK